MTEQETREAIILMLRALADDADDGERAAYLDAANRVERGEYAEFA